MIKVQYASTNRDGRDGETVKGTEVKRTNIYFFGQKYTYRLRNVERRKKLVEVANILYKYPCGYSQAKRYDLWNLCVKAKWDITELEQLLKKKPKINTDCSQYYACLINLTYGKEKLPKTTTTATLPKLIASHKDNFKILPYSPNNIRLGDGLNAPNHHIITVVRR